MVPVWTTFSDFFCVMIMQRQITWKWYNIQLYLQWPTYKRSYRGPMIYRTAPFSMSLNLPPASRSRHSLTLNISETVRHTDIVYWDLYTPYSTVSFRMTLSDSRIFNDMKHRAVSLRQLSFLFLYPSCIRRPRQGVTVKNSDMMFGTEKLEWLGYLTVK